MLNTIINFWRPMWQSAKNKRWLWFIGIYLASVIFVGMIATLLKAFV